MDTFTMTGSGPGSTPNSSQASAGPPTNQSPNSGANGQKGTPAENAPPPTNGPSTPQGTGPTHYSSGPHSSSSGPMGPGHSPTSSGYLPSSTHNGPSGLPNGVSPPNHAGPIQLPTGPPQDAAHRPGYPQGEHFSGACYKLRSLAHLW